MKNWEEIGREIDAKIRGGVKVPKTDEGFRPVTRIVNDRIYARTGVKTEQDKYTTKDMLRFAYQSLVSEGQFDYNVLERQFPQECKQGTCVYSITGGILEKLGLAKRSKRGNKTLYLLKSD